MHIAQRKGRSGQSVDSSASNIRKTANLLGLAGEGQSAGGILPEVMSLLKNCKVSKSDMVIEEGRVSRKDSGYLTPGFGYLRKGKLHGEGCELRVLEKASDKKKMAAYLREFLMRHELEHPRLRKMLGISNFPFYAIVLSRPEESCPLTDLLWANRELSLPSGLGVILRDVATGLTRLHAAGAIHGAISADVVLVTTRVDSHSLTHVLAQLGGLGGVKYSIPSRFDLDEDQEESSEERSRIRNTNKGARWYMPPEVLRSERETKASDIFSFGMLAYASISMTYDRASMNGFFHPNNNAAWELKDSRHAPHEAAVAFHKRSAHSKELDDDAFRVSYCGKTGKAESPKTKKGKGISNSGEKKDVGVGQPGIAYMGRRRGRRGVGVGGGGGGGRPYAGLHRDGR